MDLAIWFYGSGAAITALFVLSMEAMNPPEEYTAREFGTLMVCILTWPLFWIAWFSDDELEDE